MEKLDARYERSRKPGPGVSASARRERLEGHPSTSGPPTGLPAWMVDHAYRQDAVLVPTNPGPMHLVSTTPIDDPTAGEIGAVAV